MNPVRASKFNKYITDYLFKKLRKVLTDYILKKSQERIINMNEKKCLRFHKHLTVYAEMV